MHDDQIVKHGGLPGIRDEGALESALDRGKNIEAYGQPTIYDLAAAVGYGVIKNHPFNDANKRTALTCIGIFLGKNGQRLVASQVAAVKVMYEVASNNMTEQDLAAWIQFNSRPR